MKTAFIFSGQGSQFAGMGKDLYENHSECRLLFDEASEILKIDFKSEIFENGEILKKNEYCQPAIAAVSAAALKVAELKGMTADVVAGLSLGEYTALYASGVFTFENLIKITRRRGYIMENYVSDVAGGMSAVLGLDSADCLRACEKANLTLGGEESVVCANFNAPGQVVISGGLNALALAEQLASESGAKRVLSLNVAGPFHTSYYEAAAEELYNELKTYTFGEMKIPVISNATAYKYAETADIAAVLRRHMISPVLFQKSVENMIEDGVGEFYEFGPGKTLTGFVKKINKEVKAVSGVSN